MRVLFLGALALGSGCNWVFGLDPVRLTDAQIIDAPPDAPLPTVKLSAITPMLTMTGTTTGQAAFTQITPAPMVWYGRIGEALTPTTYTSENVPVGYEFADSPDPWRLVYQLDGGVPHEVHWKPSSANVARAVVLQLTPNDREPVPTGGVFTLSPTSPPTWNAPRIYTTNAWTITRSPTTTASSVSANYDSSATVALAGAKRKPDPAKDYEVLVDYRIDNDCEVVSGAAAFLIDLATGNGPAQPWEQILKLGDYTITSSNEFLVRGNVAGANNIDYNQVVPLRYVTYGPAGGIPLYGHTESAVLSPIVPTAADFVPVPAGILLAKCIDGPTKVRDFNYPSRIGLQTIGTLTYTTIPILLGGGGPSVRNLMSFSSMVATGPYNLEAATHAFAIMPTIDGASVSITTPGVAPVPAGGVTASLDFMLAGKDALVDLYEATLYRIDGGQLVPVREFTFTEKPLRFDRDQGHPAGTRYVFAIRVIYGASASTLNGDFGVWGPTQTLGLTHTQAFTLD